VREASKQQAGRRQQAAKFRAFVADVNSTF